MEQPQRIRLIGELDYIKGDRGKGDEGAGERLLGPDPAPDTLDNYFSILLSFEDTIAISVLYLKRWIPSKIQQ